MTLGRSLLLGLIGSASLAASAPVPVGARSLEAEVAFARREARTAEAEAERLGKIAAGARDAAGRLRARQLAAAQALAAAEARISAAEAQGRAIAARLTLQERRLAEIQRPASLLLGGLATMARRPPLLTLADQGGIDDYVRIRILLDSSLPVIRARSSAIAVEVAEARWLQTAQDQSQRQLLAERSRLEDRRRTFAALEAEALRSAIGLESAALGAGDVALAAGEDITELSEEERASVPARRLAAELAALGPAPPSPFAASPLPPPEIAYRLPATAAVTEGFGSISPSGIRARGLTLATVRGTELVAPADGLVRFAGPFRSHDGIVILDHGRGWMTLIVNVRTTLRPGDRVRIGEPLGRALGPVGVELSRNGNRVSPALIAGSSPTLSKRNKDG